MKDESIVDVLAKLRERLGAGAFDVTDHWASDSHATGISEPGAPGQLVYISTFNKTPGTYDATLEVPPTISDELPDESRPDWLELDFETLAAVVGKHLHVRSSPR